MKIGDLLIEYDERLGSEPEPTVMTLTEGRGFVDQAVRFSKRLATEDTSNYKIVRNGDAAFNPYLLWAGAIAVNHQWEKAIVSPVYPTFRVREAFDPRFVRHLLAMPSLLSRYDAISYGSVPRRRRASVADFLEIELPSVPQVAEQRRIADVLDRADALRAKRHETLARLDELKSALVHDLIDGLGDDQRHKLSDLLLRPLRNGRSPSTDGAESAIVLTLGAITGEAFDSSAARLADFDRVPQAARVVPGELLICRGNGNAELVGRAQVAPTEAAHLVFPDTMIAGAVDPEQLHPSLASVIWNSTIVRRQIARSAKTTNGTLKVNQTALNGVHIPVPQPDEQAQAVEQLHALNTAAGFATASVGILDALFASLQQRAFRGDLFDGDFPDELADAA